MKRRPTGAAFTVLSLTAALATIAPAGVATASPNAASFNVKDFGAKGNGTTVDSPAFDKAITAASSAGGGIVEVPSGTYLARTIHLKSNITINLQAGSKIIASGSGIDAPESNSNDKYQDFGHSHFNNALLRGAGVENVSFTGSGVIDGNNKLETGENIKAGIGDKMLSLTLCKNISISGITLRQAGHFAIIANGCNGIKIDKLKVDTGDDRDGINFINSSNIEMSNSTIVASDDAVAFKSDYALGKTFVSENNIVRDTSITSTENNALQFGSETCGSFRNIQFKNLTIGGASKAGLGIVSMDGATIEKVSYENITLTKTGSPIFMHIGNRGRCPGKPGPGKIRDISFKNVTGTNLTAPKDIPGDPDYASTISGRTDSPIENITFDTVKLTVPGGHPASEATANPPEVSDAYPPRIFGKRPSYGFWIRHAKAIGFVNSVFEFDKTDGRPAITTDDVAGVFLSGSKVERSGGTYDVTWRKSSAQQVSDSTTTSGQALRIRTQY
ncbi:glycoside hydrolase family 28 protein, partial [Amycolatopsis sp. NPDC059657]|uniref:glycoside hydrolase family 28 protein n=1 Tax=Amycolatopsis sp. NPDC059657 TaxID=3346899 RepID=UPI00366FF1A0